MSGKIPPEHGFRALHETEPIAGLRSSGKGANRTILGCLFRLIGWDKWSFCRRGVAGAAASPGRTHLASSGAVLTAADKSRQERARNRDDSVFGGTDTP
jgi:hypothetical protein